MMVAWGDTSKEDEASEQGEEAASLMARGESDSNFEPVESYANSRIRYVVLTKLKLRNYCSL